jgi:hypothetical protein
MMCDRYAKGGGKLWDLEFLVDDKGARVAAFSGAAGKVNSHPPPFSASPSPTMVGSPLVFEVTADR